MAQIIDMFTRQIIADDSKVDGLPVGSIVSYQDMANPRQTAIVVQAKADSKSYGQQCVFEDGHASQVSQGAIDGPGGWRLVEGRTATAAQVADAIERSAKLYAERRAEQERAMDKHRANEQAIKDATPSWAKSAIVATFVEDRSDSQTDYHGTTTKRTIILAWSKHNRRLFPEMRKAAALSDISEIAELADKEIGIEHREDYSMGHGLYLKAGSRYDTGWEVAKVDLGYINCQHLDTDSLEQAAN